MVTSQLPGRTITSKGREYLYFSGTSYLGLSQLADFRELVKEGMDRVGIHFGGSRLSNIQIDVFDESEVLLAEKCGAEAALIVSSGTVAGQTASFLAPKTSRVYVAPGTHAAFSTYFQPPSDGGRADWEKLMKKSINSTSEKTVIVTNSVDPLYCQPIDIDWMRSLVNGKNTTLIVDDSHGMGVMGARGEGLYTNWSSASPGNVIFAGSLGKAMGIPAGFVLGNRDDIHPLKSTRTYGGSSPANPAFLYAFNRAEEIHRRQLSKLRTNIKRFLGNLEKPGN
nr:pyridoxal phosphate-dependent aminotransferase family protein [Saprospiraceae bacterium]